jgi:threonine/homoserine/homoserine lactone efflux protein
VSALALGILLGWIGSMPVGGPVSLFVFKRGAAGRYREAIVLAAGAALAEAGYCGAALGGYDLVLDRWPALRPILVAIGAVVMIALGIHFLITRHFVPDGAAPPAARSWYRDGALGFTMVILNPSVLVSWLAALAALHAVGLDPGDGRSRVLFAGGVAVGIVGWFATLVWLVHRGRSWIRPWAFDRALRVFGGGLCAAGLYTIFVRFLAPAVAAVRLAP